MLKVFILGIVRIIIILKLYQKMCINKYHIRNQAYRPLDLKTSAYIDVNCNHCIQCQSNRSAAFAYRIQREVHADPKNTLSIFVTFTYSPNYLPTLTYFDDDNNLKTISTWNRQHLQRFHKVLRRQLQYYFGQTACFKFLSCCERGSDREYIDDFGNYRVATQRPHYHNMYVLFNVNEFKAVRNLPSAFYDWVSKTNSGLSIRSFFHWLIQDRWYYGHVKDIEVTRDVDTCTRYVAQYCTKNINENLFNIGIHQIYRFNDPDFNERSKKRKVSSIRFTSLLPRLSQSANLGFKDSKFFINELFTILASGKKVILAGNHRSSTIPLPYYYYKKICKETVICNYHSVIRRSNGYRDKDVYTVPYLRVFFDWDNVRHSFIRFVPKVYTKTYYTALGVKLRKIMYNNKLDRTVKSLRCFFMNPDYFNNLLSKYICHTDVFLGISRLFFGTQAISQARIWLGQNLDRIRSLLPDFFHLNYFQLKNLEGDYKQLDILIKTFSLCRTVHSFFNQIAYRRIYEQNLGSVAQQDPELLIPHFININSY